VIHYGLMGTEQTLRSAARPGLLAFVLVAACGGRYATTTGDSDGSDAKGTGAAPGKMSPPDNDEPDDDVGMPTRGGASTGSGGGTASGGVVGVGGTGFAGSPISTAGTNAGVPVVNDQVCSAYCSSLAKVCPDRMESVGCYKLCMSDLLTVPQSCRVKRLEDYECIASELGSTDSCEHGLALAGKLCGSDGPRPPACPTDECAQEVYGDGSGCHAILKCPHGTADLHCLETGSIPACSCAVSGQPPFMLMTGAMSSKLACVDESLQQYCWVQLP
jgi:hypothetical protein